MDCPQKVFKWYVKPLLWPPCEQMRTLYFCPVSSSFSFLDNRKKTFNNFLPIVDTCLSCKDTARQICAMVRRRPFFASFWRPVFSASRVQHISDLHSKFALRLHHVSKYGRHPICDLHMSSHYGELRPTSGWDRFESLGYPQQISTAFASWLRYCSDVAHRKSTKLCTMFGRLPGCMYTFLGLLPQGGHRPSCWALAHISSFSYYGRLME